MVVAEKQVLGKSKHQNTVTDNFNSGTIICQGLQQLTEIHAIFKHQNHIYLDKFIPGFRLKRSAVSTSTERDLVN